MKNPNLKELAIDTMVIINAAITNIRLYPPSSNLIKNSIDKAYSTLISILEQADSVVLAESEKNLLVSGESLSEKDQKKPQVVAILDLFLSFGIKSLAFEKGLEKEELRKFLDILSRQPEDLDKEGGLHQVVEGKNLTHILLDQKVYIYTGKIKKDEKIRSLSGNTLKAIASVDVLNMLLKELLINEEQKQNEAVNCLAMLGATSVDPLPDILLGIRSISENDRVAQFIPEADTTITSDESEALQEKICIALGRIGSQEEIPEIESTVVQESLLNIKSHNPKVQAAVKSVLEMIKMEQAEKEKISPPEQNGIIPAIDSETITSEKTEPVTDDLHRQLLVVDGYVQQNDTESAVKLLFDLIVKYAKEKNFTNAESLREKLFEVDAMALTEIVSSGEIIEEEKSQSIDQDHLDVWPELYEPLTGEESNAFYYAMKAAEYDTDQTIIQQGELNSNLYFINQGQLKMVYRQGEREILLGTSNAGDIVGADTFFSVSVCTTSVITLSHVKLTFLENKILSKWKSDFPVLGSKLHDFCMKIEKTHELLKKKDMDRRSHKRVPVSGKVLFQLLEASGTPIGKVIKGNLSDISMGGLSFFMKIAKEETARKFLGRNLRMQFVLPACEAQDKISRNGKVVGVHYHLSSDYSIHVKFDKNLSEEIIETAAEKNDTGREAGMDDDL